MGEVDDLKPFISSARISIVPLLQGSGSRLKCLEAMALETPLVSTSKGAEGIDHRDSIFIADTPEEFINKMKFILKNDVRDTTKKAHEIFMSKYSLSSAKERILKIFDNLN